jgi:predicted DNA-binding transcriptional regulator AlpA
MSQLGSIEAGGSRLLGLEQTATYLGMTTRSLDRLVAKGVLVPVKIVGVRRTLFDRRDIDAFVESAKQSQGYVGACK